MPLVCPNATMPIVCQLCAPACLQVVYALSALLIYSRLLEAFKYSPSIGATRPPMRTHPPALPLSRPFAPLSRLAGMLLLILWNMLPEIFNWSVLVVFITVGFGITCTILMPGMMWATEELNRPFYIPWLAIIGDFDIQVPPLHVPLPSTPCLQVVIPPCSFRCLCPSPPLLSGRLRLLWVDALVARHAAHVGHLRGGAAVAVHLPRDHRPRQPPHRADVVDL